LPQPDAPALSRCADAMQARGIRSPSGRTAWHPATVLSVLRAIEARPATLALAA
jgi:hypothetical protein